MISSLHGLVSGSKRHLEDKEESGSLLESAKIGRVGSQEEGDELSMRLVVADCQPVRNYENFKLEL